MTNENQLEMNEGSHINIQGRIINRKKLDEFSYYFVRHGNRYLKTKIDNSKFPDLTKGDLVSFSGIVKRQVSGDLYLEVEDITDHRTCKGILPNKQYFEKQQDNSAVQTMFDPETFMFFEKISESYRTIREFLNDRGFMEVITPILMSETYPSKAKEFSTSEKGLFLRKIQEPRLKPYLIAGYDKVYELGKVFRNEGTGTKFLNEFTNLDIMMNYVSLNGLLDLSKDFVVSLASIFGKKIKEISTKRMEEFEIKGTLEEKAKIFKKEIAPGLEGTFIVTGYPSSLAPTAKPNEDGTSQEFRVFHNGYSFMHGYIFNDNVQELESNERVQIEKQSSKGKLWNGFQKLLAYGIPNSGGVGVGIEKMIQLFADKPSIKDVLFYKK